MVYFGLEHKNNIAAFKMGKKLCLNSNEIYCTRVDKFDVSLNLNKWARSSVNIYQLKPYQFILSIH